MLGGPAGEAEAAQHLIQLAVGHVGAFHDSPRPDFVDCPGPIRWFRAADSGLADHCLGWGVGRRTGLALVYFLSWSSGIGRLTRTVILALSGSFIPAKCRSEAGRSSRPAKW